MRPEIIHTKDENNESVRECPKCHNWFSLLGIKDEHGNRRNFNHSPANKGICTCHLGWK